MKSNWNMNKIVYSPCDLVLFSHIKQKQNYDIYIISEDIAMDTRVRPTGHSVYLICQFIYSLSTKLMY